MGALAEKKLFLLDMDGTIYLGDRLFDGAAEFLRRADCRIFNRTSSVYGRSGTIFAARNPISSVKTDEMAYGRELASPPTSLLRLF